MQVERSSSCVYTGALSGERVSNALVTCPKEGNNLGKLRLIPYVLLEIRCSTSKGSVDERPQRRFRRGLRTIS
jgi:hypothetical protein